MSEPPYAIFKKLKYYTYLFYFCFSMPTKIPDEVITINDEPSSKKPRLEEITDQISLSSDSGDSVEISDEEEASAIDDGKNENNKGKESDPIELDEIDGSDQTEEINNAVTQMVNKQNDQIVQISNDVEKDITTEKQEKDTHFHEMVTQMPQNTSVETIDEDERPHSMEVTYDFPSIGKEKVTVLDKIDDENLPSTNDTDDVHITCGQVANSSQDVEKTDSEDVPKINGVETFPVKTVQNGVSEDDKEIIVTAKVVEGVNVEDMLADFVDEVNEDTAVQ